MGSARERLNSKEEEERDWSTERESAMMRKELDAKF